MKWEFHWYHLHELVFLLEILLKASVGCSNQDEEGVFILKSRLRGNVFLMLKSKYEDDMFIGDVILMLKSIWKWYAYP